MTVYAAPGQPGSPVTVESRYDNFIGGEWVAAEQGRVLREPLAGHRPDVLRDRPQSTPRTSSWRSTPRTAPSDAWGRTSAAERAEHPEQDRRPHRGQPRDAGASPRRWDNGKPIRETLAADLPLAVDHFRYFAGAIRAQEGGISRDRRRHRRLPLPRAARRRRPDHPVELPDPDGRRGSSRPRWPPATAWCIKPAEQTPCVDPEADGADRRPAARRACSTSSTASASRPASRWRRSSRIAKIAFTGETTTGRLIMQYASAEPDPGHAGAGRQEPEHLLRGRRSRQATTSTTRRSRASRCSPSTRARSAPARPAR